MINSVCAFFLCITRLISVFTLHAPDRINYPEDSNFRRQFSPLFTFLSRALIDQSST